MSILGTGFESVHLTDILAILSTFYIEEKLQPQIVLRQLCEHQEILILVLFMDETDRNGEILEIYAENIKLKRSLPSSSQQNYGLYKILGPEIRTS